MDAASAFQELVDRSAVIRRRARCLEDAEWDHVEAVGCGHSVDADEALDSEGFGIFGERERGGDPCPDRPNLRLQDFDIEVGLRRRDGFSDSDVEVEDTVDACPLGRHEGADTMHATDQSVALEPTENFAQCRSADAVALREVRFGRQLLVRRVCAVRYLGRELMAHLFGEQLPLLASYVRALSHSCKMSDN